MSLDKEFKDTREERAGAAKLDGTDAADAELEQALRNFRSSVNAWSDAELSRPRTAKATMRRRGWRFAAGWALGCALIAGGVGAGIHERELRIEQARVAAQLEAQHQSDLAAQRAKEDEELLAKVDSDISKEVPSAMEPLAQLMAEDVQK
jgi:hypothetical protein